MKIPTKGTGIHLFGLTNQPVGAILLRTYQFIISHKNIVEVVFFF